VETTGIIFASVDTDHANIESWNRWYDLEHLPPNIALPGITTGRRYVAPPELHAARGPARPLDGFEAGKGVNLTIYTLCSDPSEVMDVMTREREVLEAAGRMAGAGRRVVRAGDAMTWRWGVANTTLAAAEQDLPHIAHTAIRVVLRRGGDSVESSVAPAAVTVEGVHAVLSFAASFMSGTDCDLYLLEGDPAEITGRCRAAAPYPDDAEIVLDAPFALVVPFDYSFAKRIRASDLPETIDE
jgi:hypothetical protein